MKHPYYGEYPLTRQEYYMQRTWDPLYKKASTGAIIEWRISVDGNKITTSWGQQSGKIQTETETISAGKNIGRSNETTPEEQALAEADAHFIKKLKKDYVRVLENAGQASELIGGGILPILAQQYDKHAAKIAWPAYAQRKYDGHRCIACIDARGNCTLWSRTRKPITSMTHIVDALEAMKLKSVTLDGELFVEGQTFEQLTSLIRPEYAKADAAVVQYHIYDIANKEPYSARLATLRQLLKKGNELIRPVETVEVADEAAMFTYFEQFTAENFEGLILRNADGLYVNKRSYDLQKVKAMLDSEFTIVGVEEGRARMAGHGVFVCATESGQTFSVKMQGTLSDLKAYWDNPKDYIGRLLTVKYQNLSDTGIPRFPVGLRLAERL